METTNFSIKYWAEDDKPREKLMLKGKSVLSDAELMAILIGSGSRNESAVELSQRILSNSSNNLNSLAKLTIKQLMEFKGIGEAKAITIIAALELGKRRRDEEPQDLIQITSSKITFQIMQPIIGDLLHEEFWVLYLNNSCKVIHKSQMSKGGIASTIVDARMIFKMALEHNATFIILCHNHPSGKTNPSDHDISITKKLKIIGENLDVKVLDHVIVTDKSYYSFADDNEM